MNIKISRCPGLGDRKSRAAFSLIEMIIAFAISVVVVAGIALIWVYSEANYTEVSNYTSMLNQSRNALDVLSKEIRNSSALVAFSTNNPSYLKLTNATLGVLYTITYNTNSSTVTFATTGQPTVTNLTGCDSWTFSLFDRAPNTNAFSTDITFYPATNYLTGQLDPTFCKIIYLNWKCSRTIYGLKLNTEDVQTAQVVLRNN